MYGAGYDDWAGLDGWAGLNMMSMVIMIMDMMTMASGCSWRLKVDE